MTEYDVYKTPEADLGDGTIDKPDLQFFPTSQKKLLILFISTFGIYAVYWFYKNWHLQQARMEQKITPALRALFYIFFTHSLFRRIETAAVEKNISMSWSANTLATVFVLLTIISKILDKISGKSDVLGVADVAGILILFVIVYPLYKIQELVNRINDDEEGLLNCGFSFYNIVFIGMGSAVWILVAIGFSGYLE